MPVTLDEMTYEEMRAAERAMQECAECGALLTVVSGKWHGYDSQFILACTKDKTHSGTSRPHVTPFSETPAGQVLGKTPKWRKDKMTSELGVERSRALAPYANSLSLTQEKAMEIIQTIWPKAPEAERIKAAIVCHQYGLNPLMNHVFLVKYGEAWAMLFGIKSNRLIAARPGPYSYDDDTPRAATTDEITRKYGQEDGAKIAKANYVSITRTRDLKTGATASGFGLYPRGDKPPKGTDKGNTPQNMADIRSERQSLDRLRPGALPAGEVADERFIEGEYEEVPDVGLVSTATGEIAEPAAEDIVAARENLDAQPVDTSLATEEDFEPVEEPDETEPEKDETPVNEAQIADMKGRVKELGWGMTELGAYINQDMKWAMKDLKDLKVWQYQAILAMVEKGLGEGAKDG